MKPSQATQGDGEFFNDVTFRRALKSFEYKLFADSSMSSPVYIYIYIYLCIYIYIYMDRVHNMSSRKYTCMYIYMYIYIFSPPKCR